MREIFSIGSRVEVNKNFATIRFIGQLIGQSGTWYGVEWDKPGTGKHKGDYNGIQYFTVSSEEKSASFVREKHLSRGCGLIEAIEERYMPIGKIDDSPDVINFSNMMGGREIQFVSRSKDGRCHKSKTVAWNLIQNDLDISGHNFGVLDEVPAKLSALFPRVLSLNLSKTLIDDVNVALDILSGLPNVSNFNISFNEFATRTVLCNYKPFQKVIKFYCDSVNLTFQDFAEITQLFPNLTTGSFAMNKITELDLPSTELPCFKNLEELALQGCELTQWSEVNKLSQLPNLKMLNLFQNKIHSVELNLKDGSEFPALQRLILAKNEIPDWQSFRDLTHLKNLKNLILYQNPLCELNKQRFRDEVIAKLPNLEVFNKTEIFKEERRSAAILYVKMYYSDWLKAGGSAKPSDALACTSVDRDFQTLHPTYARLFAEVGDGVVESENKCHKITSQLIKVNVIRKELDGKEAQAAEMKILGSMSISKVKLLIGRLLKLPSSAFNLSYRSHRFQDKDFAMDCDLKEIAYYSVENGDFIVAVLS